MWFRLLYPNPIIMKITLLLLVCLFLASSCTLGQNLLEPPLPELPTAKATAVGLNSDSLANLIRRINSTPPNDFRGMVVIKDNKLVVEEYFSTYWRETIHDIRSAGKSVTALLLGIAIDKGLVKNIDQPVYSFFTKKKYTVPPNDGHRDITIRHLLTMSSGLDADNEPTSAGSTAKWLMKNDWVNLTTSFPMAFKSGKEFRYNDVCPMLIGAIIEETSGQKLADFANENLFKPLGIREYYWYTAPNGSTAPMGNLYITTLDFARIGLLVLNKGRWQGKQIISPSWITPLFQKQIDITDDRFATGYSYFWYLGSKDVNGHKIEYAYASGNGGNTMFVVPSHNLVVCLTSGAYGQRYGGQRSQNIFTSILQALILN